MGASLLLVTALGLSSEAHGVESLAAIGFGHLTSALMLGMLAMVVATCGFVIVHSHQRRRAQLSQRKALRVAQRQAASLGGSHPRPEYLALASHGVRTPMTGIVGMADLLLETDLSAEQREYAQTIRRCADTIFTLLVDIEDMSKIETHQLELESIPFTLRGCIDHAVKPWALCGRQKGLTVTCAVDELVPERLVGDPGRLRQVIVHLVRNAVQYTERGRVTVHVGARTESEQATVLTVSVTDSGCGISPDDQKVLFDPFAEARRGRPSASDGAGLGLVIAAQLARRMGGEIRLESVLGMGSTFHFIAHLETQAEVAAIPTAEPIDVSGKRVLVVEPDATHRWILTEMLTAARMDPVAVATAEQGTEQLLAAQSAGAPFAVVLCEGESCDVEPAMAVAIRAVPTLHGTPLVLTTTSGEPGDARRAWAWGIAGYLPKPVSRSELSEVIGAVLAHAPGVEQRPPLVTRHSLRERRHRLTILLAEDNPVVRAVISRVLERRGHRVVAAGNGQQAIEVTRATLFDLVLMDVEMPILDGIGATAVIRRWEASTGAHLPIIALTSHVMQGDRQRCFAAGMDGYLSKPVQPEELMRAIDAVMALHPLEPATDEAAPTDIETKTLNRDAMARHVGSEPGMIAEVLRIFERSGPRLIGELQRALSCQDAYETRRAAHQLRGVLGMLGAESAAAMAASIEQEAALGRIERSGCVLAALEREMGRLAPELQDVMEHAVSALEAA